MSFKDRNPLSLSVPRHALNKLASEMEREEAKERKRRRCDDDDVEGEKDDERG